MRAGSTEHRGDIARRRVASSVTPPPSPAAARGIAASSGTAMVMAAGLSSAAAANRNQAQAADRVAGKPLLDHVLDRVRAAGSRESWSTSTISPTHSRRTQAPPKARRDDLGRAQPVAGTAGGLVRAQTLIDSDPFLAINATICGRRPADTLKFAGVALGRQQNGCAAAAGPARGAMNHRGMGDFTWTGRPHSPPGRSRVAPSFTTASRLFRKRAQGQRPRGRSRPMLLGSGDRRRAMLRRRHQGYGSMSATRNRSKRTNRC